MAIWKKGTSRANGGYGMGLVRSTSFGRKRVALSSDSPDFQNGDFTAMTLLERQCFDQDSVFSEEKSVLENMPQEILISILCGVEHDDLKRLFFVSKAIRESTLIAKQRHFSYSTPKKTVVFRVKEYFSNFDEAEAPNAPKQSRVPRHRLGTKKFADIAIALFATDDECWPK